MYFKLLKEKTDPSLRDVDFINYCGKPRKFPVEADVALIEWIENPDTLITEKSMSGLKKRYREFMKEQSPLERMLLFGEMPEVVSEESLPRYAKAIT